LVDQSGLERHVYQTKTQSSSGGLPSTTRLQWRLQRVLISKAGVVLMKTSMCVLSCRRYKVSYSGGMLPKVFLTACKLGWRATVDDTVLQLDEETVNSRLFSMR
jgi:hypothetical protein